MFCQKFYFILGLKDLLTKETTGHTINNFNIKKKKFVTSMFYFK